MDIFWNYTGYQIKCVYNLYVNLFQLENNTLFDLIHAGDGSLSIWQWVNICYARGSNIRFKYVMLF